MLGRITLVRFDLFVVFNRVLKGNETDVLVMLLVSVITFSRVTTAANNSTLYRG
jgi:hypothetical protein